MDDIDRKQWEYDWKHTKITRFIKDPTALKEVYDVLLKYYAPIRD